MQTCKECGVDEDKAYLYRCPICHERVCEEHKLMRSGRAFCSAHCAAGFFHDEDDEDGAE